MKIPFIEHIGVGLHITQKAIRWVELSRMGNRVKVREFDVEDLKNQEIKTGLEKLVERQNPSFPYVAVNIDHSYVRQQLLDLPGFDDPEYFTHWIDEQKENLIPGGLDQDDFILNYHQFGKEGEQKCLFVIAKKETVQKRKELLESVGLKVSIITTGQLQAGYGFILDEDFVSGQNWLVSIFEDGASLQGYDNGFLENYLNLSYVGVSTTEIIKEATTYLLTDGTDFDESQNKRLLLVKSDHQKRDGTSAASNLSIDGIQIAEMLPNIFSDQKFSADYSIAVGMAVKQLYPALDTINLQDEESLGTIENEIQKQNAFHTGIFMGGLVVLAFFVLLMAQFVLNSKLEGAEQKVTLLQNDINTVNVATQRVKGLKQQANQARELVTERTSMAKTLTLVGNSLPGRVWYNEVLIRTAEDEKEAIIYGYAYNDSLIASLMERLERKLSTDNVRLIYSEAVNSSDVYDDVPFDHTSLVQFEIRMSINSEAG